MNMAPVKKCVVVIDGANVACQKDGKAHISKLAAAIQFFRSLELVVGRYPVKCVAFAPNFWLNVKPLPDTTGLRENEAMETTTDWTLLNELVQKDYVVLTPSQSHDDFYVIDYAVKYDGFIVTNDMFRDHVSNKRSFHGKKLTSNWVRSHCIDFTFVGTEFMPNPRAMERVLTFQPSVIESTASAASLASTSTTALPNMILQKTLLNDENGQDSTDVDVDEMVVDHAGTKSSKKIDLSEVTYYKVPRQLLPMLHGQNGETMEKFQEYTGTYIVLPSHAVPKASLAGSMSDVLTLSIYGPEARRQQAVGYLDAFLLEMQQKQESGFHQWQQYMPYQAYHTVTHPQHVAAKGKMPPQDDQTMEIDPY